MQLHRVHGSSDWQDVTPVDMNYWQRLAVRTLGVITPGNFISVVGFGLSLSGLIMLFADRLWLSLALLAAGRSMDLLDGWVADKTGTKSRLGEWVDAISDKILSLGALIILPAAQLMPWWLAGGLLLVHGLIALIITVSNVRSKKTHSSPAGKISMAMTWVALPLFILAAAIPAAGYEVMRLVALSCGEIALLLATAALIGYARLYAKSAFS